jgi:CSLREA domain-containing protein
VDKVCGRLGFARVMSMVLGLLLAIPGAAGAATITVNANGDVAANNGFCTLREAITAANTNTPSGALAGECAAGSGAPTIDTIDLFTNGPLLISPSSALPSLTSPMTLDATAGAGCAGAGLAALDGTSAGAGAAGINFAAGSSNSTICGFAITNFSSGITVSSDSNTIQGNVSSSNANTGVLIDGGDSNQIRGNNLGTNVPGTAAAGNAFGIAVEAGSQNNVISGNGAGGRNLISGNTVVGVIIEQPTATGNVVEGNLIGTNTNGTTAIPNGQQGVRISSGAASNLIGGGDAGEGNLISGNVISGISIEGASNQVFGNLIGTNLAGTAALPNGSGVELTLGATGNQVGAPDTSVDATTPGFRNVISGNTLNGVRLVGTGNTANTVEGNFIGTDKTGLVGLGNGGTGVVLSSDETGNLIGGTAAGAGNVISANGQGVHAETASGANSVVGNLIGTDRGGAGALGNTNEGILLEDDGSTVGGTAAGTGNTIANNGSEGVLVETGTGNRILRNVIFGNGLLGINLAFAGNSDQERPSLTSALTNSVDTTIAGTLLSDPSQTYRIELFSSSACDSSGSGEGQTFLAAIDNVATNGAGSAGIAATVSPTAVGQVITATATNTGTGDTSEFSLCQPIAAKAEPTGPPPSGGGGRGGGGGGSDTVAPKLELSGDAKQDSKKKVEVKASCDESCTVSAEGTIKIPKVGENGRIRSKAEKFDLKRSKKVDVAEGATVKLKLELDKKAEKKLGKVIKKKKSEAKVTVTATDAAGNEAAEKFGIKVKK